MTRILTALVLIAAVVSLLLFGPLWAISLFATLVAGLAAYEYRELALKLNGDIPLWWLVLALLTIFSFTLPGHVPDLTLPALSLLTFLLFVAAAFRAPLARVLPDTAFGLFALLYTAYPLTLIPLIKSHRDAQEGDGAALLLFLFVCVWAGDIFALYIGKNFGKRKLAPKLSPNKTWEGSIASVLGSVLCGMALFFAGTRVPVLHIAAPAWQMILLAILLNVAAQIGDLVESALKRGAGVKDSGTLLPGHGGILDRIDALLLAAPVLWYALLLKDWQGLLR
jgi:phosphatidate cytidylyltransferase